MWPSLATWLIVAPLGLSNAYFISVFLKPVEIDAAESSSDDSIENIFKDIERPAASILEGTKRLLPALEASTGRDNESPLEDLSIAGRISIPASDLHHPRTGYHGRTSLRVSDALSEAADISLTRTASGKSQASTPQRAEDGLIVATNNVPAHSVGRCFDFAAPEGEFILHSIRLSDFADDDEIPIGFSIFSAPGCRQSRGFVGYQELKQTSIQGEHDIPLAHLQQPISREFSILPVYATADGESAHYISDKDISRDIGPRPDAPNPLNQPKEVHLSGSLLANSVADYLGEFDVPWELLADTRPATEQQVEEEEKREATPPPTLRRNRPQPAYINPRLPIFPDQTLTGSPERWVFRPADSDDEPDSARGILRSGYRGGPRLAHHPSPVTADNLNQNQQDIDASSNIALDIGDYDLSENGEDGDDLNLGLTQLGDEVFITGYPNSWLWNINTSPETAGLDSLQLANRDKKNPFPDTFDKDI